MYEPMECVFDQFPKQARKTLLRKLDSNVWTEDTFKPTVKKESFHEIRHDNGFHVLCTKMNSQDHKIYIHKADCVQKGSRDQLETYP